MFIYVCCCFTHTHRKIRLFPIDSLISCNERRYFAAIPVKAVVAVVQIFTAGLRANWYLVTRSNELVRLNRKICQIKALIPNPETHGTTVA